MARTQYIGVLDCNNFFVSCERLFRPDLQHKPVAVLSSNDGCIVARSQEVKDSDIPMGVPVFKVKDTLKDIGATTFSSNFTLYRDISRRVFEVMRTELDVVDQYSIDEAFFSLNAPNSALLQRVKEQVELQVGVPVSLGLGHSKTQAKYANSRAKKTTGVAYWNELTVPPSAIVLSDIWGVGGRLAKRFCSQGLHTVADLLAADTAQLRCVFGVVAVRLQQELRGTMVYPVGATCAPQKTVMSSQSFAQPVFDPRVLAEALAHHVRQAAADLRAMDLEARYIKLFISPGRYSDFMFHTRVAEHVLPVYTNDTWDFLSLVQSVFEQGFSSDVPYKKAGVLLADVRPSGGVEASLFTEFTKKSASHRQNLLRTIDGINHRFASEILTIGSTLRTSAWRSRSEQMSPRYTTQWDSVATVSAN